VISPRPRRWQTADSEYLFRAISAMAVRKSGTSPGSRRKGVASIAGCIANPGREIHRLPYGRGSVSGCKHGKPIPNRDREGVGALPLDESKVIMIISIEIG
jgi:hypothetical protein